MPTTYRRRGLGANWTIPLAQTQVPDLSIAFPYRPNDREFLLLWYLLVENTAAGARTPQFQVTQNGSPFNITLAKHTIPAGGFAYLCGHVLYQTGAATFALAGTGDTDLTQRVIAEQSFLALIELPDWELAPDYS